MRSLAIALLMLCWATAAQAQCFTLTASAQQILNAHLTKAERAAGKREAALRGCSTKPVPDGTAGAIDAAMLAGLVPEIRRHLQAVPPASRGRAVKAKPKAAARPVVRRPVRRAVMPRPRPVALVAPPAADVRPLPPAVIPPPVEPVSELAPELVAPLKPSGRLDGLRRWLREYW